MTFRHVVLFRIHEGVSNESVATAIARLESLGQLPGVVAMHIARSLDGRKGRIIVEDATFTDATAFAEFRRAPAHVAVAQEMAQISDWWIGDYQP